MSLAIAITIGRVFFDSLAAYALSRLRFRGRTSVFGTVIAVMAVPGVVLLIPKFLVLNTLEIYDTYAAMIAPVIVDPTGIFIMKQFFDTIPDSVGEAARSKHSASCVVAGLGCGRVGHGVIGWCAV